MSIVATEKRDIRALSLPEMETALADWGEPRFRARQLYEWLWVKMVKDFDDMTNLSKELRARLKEQYTLFALLEDQ